MVHAPPSLCEKQAFHRSRKKLRSEEASYRVQDPNDQRYFMLKSLSRHGVDASSMYPDVIGMSRYLNWKNAADF